MNSRWHLMLSFSKSFIRIVGCLVALYYKNLTIAIWGIVIAEILGVLEEVKDER